MRESDMSWLAVACIIVGVLVVLMMTGMPIAFALGISALVSLLVGWGAAGLQVFGLVAHDQLCHFTLIAVPLFIFMAELLMASGISEGVFEAVSRWTNRLPGGLAIASEVICAMFAAVMGSSTANTATVSTVALPEMTKRGYSTKLSAGALTSGGALGILIPPSIPMIIYGVIAEESIGSLFIGGVIPGILMLFLFVLYIVVTVKMNPQLAPSYTGVTWRDRFAYSYKIIPLLILIVLLFYCIYAGVATPSEVAAVGALVGFLYVIVNKGFKIWGEISKAFKNTVRTTCMIGWIMIGATAFSYILNRIGLPQAMAKTILSFSLSPYLIIALMNIIILGMGCVLDPVGIILITVPLFLPIIIGLGFHGVWWGVVLTINLEMGVITPPFGFNLFVLKGVNPDLSLGDIIRGSLPFIMLQGVCLALVIAFPQLILWLPQTMK
jgi:tripartite ATP-independent transporter DctM subunit